MKPMPPGKFADACGKAYNRLLFPDGREMKPDPYWPKGEILFGVDPVQRGGRLYAKGSDGRLRELVVGLPRVPRGARGRLKLDTLTWNGSLSQEGPMASKRNGKAGKAPAPEQKIITPCPSCGERSLVLRGGQVFCINPEDEGQEYHLSARRVEEAAYQRGCTRERGHYLRLSRLSHVELLQEAILMSVEIAEREMEIARLKDRVRTQVNPTASGIIKNIVEE